ncbi:hypothetical protein [Marinagarivorans cellulosilyticus]|uniref:Uncharacterized protein n=1 Tax=Marinagarivorans cellulosilyticus TaxID=2721545 RepID=A0AAN1WH40_9GAMM|nr:hypothetical protein [Marinagarivorans cellulosilyticus]BCD97430.1 hypothetical protein MARGE09_P1631 [Marinagarivorans cellulosilyticus]
MKFKPEQIVLAGLSMTGSNKPSEMECVEKADNDYTVTYVRSSDSKKFSYDCAIEGNQVRWFGKDIGGWNENNRVYFENVSDELRMELHNWGKLIIKKTFKVTDF